MPYKLPNGVEAADDAWPDDTPFPLSDAECVALVRGHRVPWRGTVDDFSRLPGRYEVLGGKLGTKR